MNWPRSSASRAPLSIASERRTGQNRDARAGGFRTADVAGFTARRQHRILLTAISYFDRMRQLEEQSEQVVAHFPPISYLLTSERYPAHLKQMLMESLASDVGDRKKASREIDAVIAILGERKKARALRRLSVVNFVTIPEIERWLKLRRRRPFRFAGQRSRDTAPGRTGRSRKSRKSGRRRADGDSDCPARRHPPQHHLPAIPEQRSDPPGLKSIPAWR